MLLYILLGCPQPTPPVYSCEVSKDWIENPIQPSDVGEEETFCEFYQFGWQSFFAQTSPSEKIPTQRVFETKRVYHPNTENQCSLKLKLGRKLNIKLIEPRIGKTDLEDKQADQRVLYDQNGNILYYSIWYSEEMCQATDEFIAGTMEIKASWQQIEKSNLKDYFYVEVDKDKYLGMVGLHMAIWTPKHHEMLWYTWEHKNNAPLCNGTSEVKLYSLTSKSASKCLSKKGDCEKYKFNVPPTVEGIPPLKGIPNEICREFEYGNQKGKSINGNDNELNAQVIKDLNEQLVGKDGLLEKLPKDHAMKIWSNYKMIGGIWTKNGANSSPSPIDSKGSKGDPSSLQRGSLELTNMSMETFEQGDTSFVPNCFGCHNYDEKDQTNVSHIYKHLKSNKAIE